jgi:broad specificity phosphatase PhoE
MKLYLVRHGESEANIQHIISNRQSPFGLTSRGKGQANALAENLKDIPITAIYSSPVLRARETAEILSQKFHIQYQITEALREYDCGILEEKSDEESWRLHGEIADDWTLNHNYLRKPEGGESFLDIQNRFLPFIESLKQVNDEHILLVAHGGLFHLMLPLILMNIDDYFVKSHGLSHIDCVIAELRSDTLVCKQWGEIQF